MTRSRTPCIRLILNADDFGLSPPVNQAVLRAHTEGVLTSASLMVTGAACPEAVQLARAHPGLGVGLHLTLVCGKPALPAARIPGLASEASGFSSNPVWAGLRYFFLPRLRCELAGEIEAQFARFAETGLKLDHVNGHLNMHLHPVILGRLLEQAERWGVRALRLTREPFLLNLRLARGRLVYRASHALDYHLLSRWAGKQLRRRRIFYTDAVFGLLQNGRVDAAYLAALIERLPPGDSELYSHPSLDQFRPELDALLSPLVRGVIRERNVQLTRYQDLIES